MARRLGKQAGTVRPERDDGQPRVCRCADAPRRRGHRRLRGARGDLRGRRHRDRRRRAAAPSRQSDGIPEPARVTAAVRETNIHQPVSSLLCIENTHNRRGGAAVDAERVRWRCACRAHPRASRSLRRRAALQRRGRAGSQPGRRWWTSATRCRSASARVSAPRSVRWWSATCPSSTRCAGGASASAAACARQASSPRPGCTRSSTTSIVSPMTTPTRSSSPTEPRRMRRRHGAEPVGPHQPRDHRHCTRRLPELAARARERRRAGDRRWATTPFAA